MNNNFPTGTARSSVDRKYLVVGTLMLVPMIGFIPLSLDYSSKATTTNALVAGWSVTQRHCPTPTMDDRAIFDAAQVFNDGRRRSYYTPTCTVEWQRQD